MLTSMIVTHSLRGGDPGTVEIAPILVRFYPRSAPHNSGTLEERSCVIRLPLTKRPPNIMGDWILPTLSQVLALESPLGTAAAGPSLGRSLAQQRVRADRQWTGAVAALEALLALADDRPDRSAGLVISGPFPVLSQPNLVSRFQSWAFTADRRELTFGLPFQLSASLSMPAPSNPGGTMLPLFPGDPLATEQFCLVLTPSFSVVLVLGESLPGAVGAEPQPGFWFSFEPEAVERIWQLLRLRVVMLSQPHVDALDAAVAQFPIVAPNAHTVAQFSHLLLAHLPEPMEALPVSASDSEFAAAIRRVADRAQATVKTTVQTTVQSAAQTATQTAQTVAKAAQNMAQSVAHSVAETAHRSAYFTATHASSDRPPDTLDIELLKAIAHEVRTPLTTIRTLTRSLMRRPDMSPDALKRLEMIDRECSEQADRFGLIFRAVELETSNPQPLSVTETCLSGVLAHSIPRWQQQAQQRGLTLAVKLPEELPMVMTNPTMLDQALTGLIDRSARSLPSGSRIQVEVTLAGHQLKLQVETTPIGLQTPPLLQALGQMLMFQPETGSLSLNLAVTKNLFQAIGGKLTVRQKAEQGEVLTIFLPLEQR
jgi:signal transduction histidine kinase